MEMYLYNDRALTSEEVANIEEMAQATAHEHCFNVSLEDHSINDSYTYVLCISSVTCLGQDIEMDDMITFLQELRKDLRRALTDLNDWYVCFQID